MCNLNTNSCLLIFDCVPLSNDGKMTIHIPTLLSCNKLSKWIVLLLGGVMILAVSRQQTSHYWKQFSRYSLAKENLQKILLSNLWSYCHLLAVLLCWQVMMRLFSPRKTTLLFVIRDKTKVDDQPSMLSFRQNHELNSLHGSRSLGSLLILLNMAFV